MKMCMSNVKWGGGEVGGQSKSELLSVCKYGIGYRGANIFDKKIVKSN